MVVERMDAAGGPPILHGAVFAIVGSDESDFKSDYGDEARRISQALVAGRRRAT